MASRKILKEILGWVLAIILPVILVFALNIFVFTISSVSQDSMRNTLIPGDVVFYSRLSVGLDKLRRGDIILFLTNGKEMNSFADKFKQKIRDVTDVITGRGQTTERYVKRIVGLPGDVIDIRADGSVYVNGEKENKAYVRGLTPPRGMDYPITVPENCLFVMGDNREASKDSRDFGCISIKSVEGKAVFIVWPLSKIGKIK
ncbi:MAG TPA: signal peptidase I [Clostridiaceae bacterium]|mgnify:CR=1 FL=1|nr:signal peptidase I [Clostridiaceae bacterium]